ncbi:hypothetical protein Rhopal_005782-T1 [Rhodotorula paludigena]|uniref:Uncharacterized protein n=1 Tax=Rhodotorula paludigena TaxID=86838 RepID=A0AAV5GS17_9BASI|nr:hypothetical protein Rhopal_005782-T1 [Rhodotorula paludigena]
MSNALARRPPRQLREIAPLPRPSSSSRLSVNEVFPSFAPVTPATLSPYLHLGHPPSPPWSLAFYRSHAQFLLSCLPVPSSPSPTYQELSLASSGHLLPGGAVLPPLSLFTLAHAPNRAKLQADFVPWDAHEGAAALPRDVRTWLRVCTKVVAWLWDFDEAQVGEGDVLSVIQGAPLEVHFLIREYADVLRIAALLARLERAVLDDLRKHQNSTDLAPKQRAALVLLEWMLMPGKEQERKVMLLKKRENGEEAGWKDWLKRVDEGERISVEALYEWEKAVQKLEEWEKAVREFEVGLASSKSFG